MWSRVERHTPLEGVTRCVMLRSVRVVFCKNHCFVEGEDSAGRLLIAAVSAADVGAKNWLECWFIFGGTRT